MSEVTVQFFGSGDAFGSGGRFQTCISVRWTDAHLLLDCGTSSLIAMKRCGLDPGSIDIVAVTHLHGDHFGGIPFLVLDQQFARRDRTLVVAGPPGIGARVLEAMEVFFPGSSSVQRRFPLQFVELTHGQTTPVGPTTITGYQVSHPSGALAYALRVAAGRRSIAYTGDTEWTGVLAEVSRGVDLLISEAYSFEKPINYHLSYATLREHLPQLSAKRVVLTHVGPDMLGHLAEVAEEVAEDGLTIVL